MDRLAASLNQLLPGMIKGLKNLDYWNVGEQTMTHSEVILTLLAP